MATLTVQTMTLASLAPAFSAASAGGDAFTNDGRTLLYLKNTGGSSINVTLDALPTFSDNAVGDVTLPDTVITVPANSERIAGFFPPARFNGDTGLLSMTYSAATGLSVAAIRTGRQYA